MPGYRYVPQFDCAECGKACPPKARRVVSRRMCWNCYYRSQKRGVLPPLWSGVEMAAFWGRVDKSADCWIWRGSRNAYGYGIFLLPGERPVRAHRFAYEKTIGVISDGLVVMHSCDNPPCVNPAHLSTGTHLENSRDAARKGRNARGERNGHAKLTPTCIQSIKHSSEPQAALAKHYGVSQSAISRVKSGKRWKHL